MFTYYSPGALEKGRASFEVADLRPLPTKFERPTWHEELADQETAAWTSFTMLSIRSMRYIRCEFILIHYKVP